LVLGSDIRGIDKEARRVDGQRFGTASGGQGDPDTAVRPPVDALIEYSEMVAAAALAT